MNKTIAIFAALVCSASILSAGENLAKNGNLSALDEKGNPAVWTILLNGGAKVVYNAKGLETSGTVQFISEGKSGKESARFRQPVTQVLKPKARCRLTFMARTGNFKAKESYFIIYTDGWSRQVGNIKLKSEPGWHRYSAVITLPDYKKDAFLAFYAINFTGMAEVGDIKLEAVE